VKTDSAGSKLDRRAFLAASGTGLLAAASPAAAKGVAHGAARRQAAATGSPRKIPLGVFDPVYNKLSIDEMLDTITALGLEAIEIATGSLPGSGHCPLDELVADSAKAKAWQKRFTDRGIHIGALSCHGNPVHPDAARASHDAEIFRKTVLLAEQLGVEVIVGFSGCPGGTPTDTQPSWIVNRWPDEFGKMQDWQWEERLIPYWTGAAKLASEHGIHKLAFEMCPNFSVYNARTLMKLRDAVGPEIGANCDLSHLFWQGCDPVEVIQFLGKQNAVFHAHMKDTVLFPDNIAKYGVLNFSTGAADIPEASEIFRAVGYGHSATVWKNVVKAYMDIGYDGMMSIENEDPILPGAVGVERAAFVLKNVRSELLSA